MDETEENLNEVSINLKDGTKLTTINTLEGLKFIKRGKIIISTNECIFVNNEGTAVKWITSQVPGKTKTEKISIKGNTKKFEKAIEKCDKLERFNRLRELALQEWFSQCYTIAFELFDYFEIDGKAAKEFMEHVINNEGKKNDS